MPLYLRRSLAARTPQSDNSFARANFGLGSVLPLPAVEALQAEFLTSNAENERPSETRTKSPFRSPSYSESPRGSSPKSRDEIRGKSHPVPSSQPDGPGVAFRGVESS